MDTAGVNHASVAKGFFRSLAVVRGADAHLFDTSVISEPMLR